MTVANWYASPNNNILSSFLNFCILLNCLVSSSKSQSDARAASQSFNLPSY